MIDGPGRKKPGTPLAPATSTSTTTSTSPSTNTPGGAKKHSGEGAAAGGDRGITRRALEKLGRKMSMKPVADVAVGDRAGKTAALRMAGGIQTELRTDLHKLAPGRTFAAIDLGSSSAKMLVQRVDADGRLRTILDVKIGAALGKGVEAGKAIPAENQQRALDAMASFLKDAEQLGVSAADIPMITTAVVRNSPNGRELLDKIHGLGLVRATTLSGDDEASMGFRGALAMTHGAPGRYATLDLGGGSFQLAVGTEKGVDDGGSVQVGSNLILDTLLAPVAGPDGKGDPAVFASVDARLDDIAAMPLAAQLLDGRTLIATGGVSKFLRTHFNRDVVSRSDVDALRREVIALPYAERVALVQGTKDDVTRKALGVETAEGALDYGKKLPASASLLLHILDGIGVSEVRVSETDSRHALIQTRAAESSALAAAGDG